MKIVYGLVGRNLGHSYSRQFFHRKFEDLRLTDHEYRLFEIPTVEGFPAICSDPTLHGLNITIPYKQTVIPFLDDLDSLAERIGSVNVVSIGSDRRTTGYNTDYHGFKSSVEGWIPSNIDHALVLGSGGSSRAVQAALEDMGFEVTVVSRNPNGDQIGYGDMMGAEILQSNQLIVNTTPVGMWPNTTEMPDVPLDSIGKGHYVMDLIYNPEKTPLLDQAEARGAKVANGLEMLRLQAEKSWEIWTRAGVY